MDPISCVRDRYTLVKRHVREVYSSGGWKRSVVGDENLVLCGWIAWYVEREREREREEDLGFAMGNGIEGRSAAGFIMLFAPISVAVDI